MTGVWGTYQNPAYAPNGNATADQNWPVWSQGQQNVYQVLRSIAVAGSATVADLANFTDFRQVGNEADAGTQARYLSASWNAFQLLYNWRLANPNDFNPDDESAVLQASAPFAYGYSSGQWVTIGTSFLNDPATQADFLSVYNLLNNANTYRANLTQFLQNYEIWALSNQVYNQGGGGAAQAVANLIASSLMAPLPLSQPSPTGPDTAIDILVAVLRTAVNIVAPGPISKLIGNGILQGAGDIAKAGIAHFFTKNPQYNPMTTVSALQQAAIQIDQTQAAQFKDAFDRLLSADFQSRLSSNYGLLEAFANSQFTTPDQASSDALYNAYKTAAWQQLFTRQFHWQLIGPDQSNSSFGP